MSWLSDRTKSFQHNRALARDRKNIVEFWERVAPACSDKNFPVALIAQAEELFAKLEVPLAQHQSPKYVWVPLLQLCNRFPGPASTRLMAAALHNGLVPDTQLCKWLAYSCRKTITQVIIEGGTNKLDLRASGVLHSPEELVPKTAWTNPPPISMCQPLELFVLLTTFGADWTAQYGQHTTLAQMLHNHARGKGDAYKEILGKVADTPLSDYFVQFLPQEQHVDLSVSNIVEQRKIQNFLADDITNISKPEASSTPRKSKF